MKLLHWAFYQPNEFVMKLENNKVVLEVSLSGGSYQDFHLKDLPVNPLNWSDTNPEEPPFAGHFLCLDRWGPPSQEERANCFMHHGEASTQIWTVRDTPLFCGGVV